jgi:hypothetical protein
MPRALLVVVITGCLLGCAGVKHLPERGEGDQGIRYYRSAPYLLVYSDAKGGLVSKLLYLPDQTQVMSATPRSNLASIQATLEFDDGVLTRAVEQAGSAATCSAVLSAVETVLPLLAASVRPGGRFPQPSLYRITVHGDRITFSGGEGDAPIQVNAWGLSPPGSAGSEGNR